MFNYYSAKNSRRLDFEAARDATTQAGARSLVKVPKCVAASLAEKAGR